jgi:hypothetical protein
MPLRLLEVVVPKHQIKTVTQATLSDLCRQRKAAKDLLYQVALIEVRKAIVGAHLRVRPPMGGHIGPPLQQKKINYLYERNLVLEGEAQLPSGPCDTLARLDCIMRPGAPRSSVSACRREQCNR